MSETVSGPFPAIDALFHGMAQAGASDLHLSVGSPPLVRKDGRIQVLDPAAAPLSDTELASLLEPITPAANRQEFAESHDTDFAYEIPGPGPLPRQPVCRPQRSRRGVPRHPDQAADGRTARACRRRS